MKKTRGRENEAVGLGVESKDEKKDRVLLLRYNDESKIRGKKREERKKV